VEDGGYAINLDSNETDDGNDFGNWRYATKSGHKFHDLNINHEWDEGEPALSLWEIELWTADGNTMVASTTTDENGYYEFDMVQPGVEYIVCELLMPAWFQSAPVAGDGIVNCRAILGDAAYGEYGFGINLTSGEVHEDNDFGNYQDEGCTYTQGYWKTHSYLGPAGPEDPTWDKVAPDGADSTFFLSGQSWYDVMWTPPAKGNAYYILAHQWIAAYLNTIKDQDPAVMPGPVYNAFIDAQAQFETIGPDYDWDADPELRAQFIEWATILDMFNNGEYPGGPPHCE
jgi:hypothetical protein